MSSVDLLEREIGRLVAERQALHDLGAGRDQLEQNRLQLIRLQALLTKQVIESHLAARPSGRALGGLMRSAGLTQWPAQNLPRFVTDSSHSR